MIVKGHVKISLTLNVYDLETDATYVDSYGRVRIEDGDQFFMDWCENWEQGTGELLGASVELDDDLETEDEDEDD